jgi:hypothetical protein
MRFGTADFNHPEVIILWSNIATLPLVTVSLILGLLEHYHNPKDSSFPWRDMISLRRS